MNLQVRDPTRARPNSRRRRLMGNRGDRALWQRLGSRRQGRRCPIPARHRRKSWRTSANIRPPISMPDGRPTRRWRSTSPSAHRSQACAPMASMKHVGLNVAADSFLMSQTYIGVQRRPGARRLRRSPASIPRRTAGHAALRRFANVPGLEPSGRAGAHDFTRLAFDFPKNSTRPSSCARPAFRAAQRGARRAAREHASKGFVDQPGKTVTDFRQRASPASKVVEREAKLARIFRDRAGRVWQKGDSRIGIVTGSDLLSLRARGDARALGAEARMLLSAARKTIPRFAASVDRLLVVEELEAVIERRDRAPWVSLARAGGASSRASANSRPNSCMPGLRRPD